MRFCKAVFPFIVDFVLVIRWQENTLHDLKQKCEYLPEKYHPATDARTACMCSSTALILYAFNFFRVSQKGYECMWLCAQICIKVCTSVHHCACVQRSTSTRVCLSCRRIVGYYRNSLHGPSMFAVKAKIYGVIYKQHSCIAFNETSSYWSALKSS